MRAFIALLFVAVATAELAPLLENAEPIPGSYIIKLKVGKIIEIRNSFVDIAAQM